MAWVEKYRLEFKDTYGVLWTRKIYEDGFGGSKTDLTGTGEPLNYEFLSDSDEFDEPIRETRGMSNVYAMTNFALADLYSTEEMHFLVEDYIGATLFFKGYVNAGNCEEDYNDIPYPVGIAACCGLTYLKEIKYDDSGTYYNGRKLISQVILDILAKIGFTTFTEFVNVYEASMNDGQTDSPFDQTLIDVDIFKDMYCYDVLTEILKPFSAVIRQVNGVFTIYRPKELKEATVYGRTFTGATTKSGTSITPQYYINRSTNASNILQRPGSPQLTISPAKKISIKQDYGNKENWIENGDFFAVNYDDVTPAVDFWTKINSAHLILHHISEFLPDEEQGIAISTDNALQATGLTQDIAEYPLISATDVFTFELKFGWLNNSGSSNNAVTSVYVEIKQGAYYLNEIDDTYAEWTLTPSYISIFPVDIYGTSTVQVGFTGWTEYKRIVVGMLDNGTITCKLGGQLIDPDIYNAYAYVKFYCSSFKVRQTQSTVNGVIRRERPSNLSLTYNQKIKFAFKDLRIVERTYLATNAINGKELDIDSILGDVADSELDNVPEQFAGAMAMSVTVDNYRVDSITLSGTSGTADVVCDGITRPATFDTDLATTAANFVSAFASDYLPGGVVVTAVGDRIIFTSNVLGADFTGSTTITNTSGDLDGTESEDTPSSVTTFDYTTEWNTRGGSEADPLLQIKADETAAQYARPKQLIQMEMIDKNASDISFGLLKRYEDDLNQYSGNNRTFVVNAGEFRVKQRELTIDLIEMI